MTQQSPFEDIDPIETQEWLESIDSVMRAQGPERAHFLLEKLVDFTRRSGAYLPFKPNTAYLNTISKAQEPDYPGERSLERRNEAYIRWNALAMVVQANRLNSEYGGHIASYASAATLYEVGFNHFWRAKSASHPGDMIFMQGHSSPGIYARAYLEGRLDEGQLLRFRQEVKGGGLSSYPHPWLMPDFWQFPTVSMGLGPMTAIFQARFVRYLEHRGIVPPSDRKVWAFLGDGEMDEPESMGALTMPVREKLDNLIFVINCNLQRLDGPVRGNGKIIQELEAAFLGAGWNVIKVLWGSRWDPLLERDHKGLLKRLMEECVDGEYQNFKSKGGAYTRAHFFGKYAETREMVANMSDEEIWRLNRGGHDPQKVFAAYASAAAFKGGPTVILAKTVKGFGMGKAGEGLNVAHQQKKLGDEDLKAVRDRFNIQITDEEIAGLTFRKPAADSEELKYLKERRAVLGGYLPARNSAAPPLVVPPLEAFSSLLEGTGDREISTTMALVRMLTALVKDKNIGKHIVPIVPDEARTFGMEGMFRQIGIYSSVGQLYTPQDAEQLMFYREDKQGQILEEGINEAGSLCSWLAAATAYSNHGVNMVPFYIYYSMFGFQRVGDFMWAAGDSRARGFLVGGTAGRTTLAGEGLQHQDGHSQLVMTAIPNCVAYDPTYAFELAVIVQDGLRRMYQDGESIFYYITCMNENYAHPAMPAGVAQGILNGMYLLQIGGRGKVRVTLFGSGTILREVLAAAELLEKNYGVPADVYSVTSFSELRKNALAIERHNLLHPNEPRLQNYIQQALADRTGPFIAATDYVKTVADQIRQWIPGRYAVLGTDGYGRSDSRAELRRFFEVDRHYVAIAALKALADEGKIDKQTVTDAMQAFGIDPEKTQSLRRLGGTVTQPVEVLVPDIGGFKDVNVIDVLVKGGQQIEKETPLITIETEKAAMDVPSPAAGRVTEVKLKQGDKVSEGSVILLMEPAAASAAESAPTPGPAETPQPKSAAAPAASSAAAATAATPTAAATPAAERAASGAHADAVIDENAFSKAYASPSVRKFARELGADLGRIQGTGAKGRITAEDVKSHVKSILTAPPAAAPSALPKVPVVDFAQFGPIEIKPLSRIQRISGARLQASWINLPHVTQHEDADITELEAVRNALKVKASEEGVRLTPLAFIVKACLLALQEFPRFNSSLDASGENLVLKKYFHIGFAADTPNGLVVPVIANADRLSLYEIARVLSAMSEKARTGKLKNTEMQGGTFTVSSLGGIGGTAFTPIINAPEVAILGVSKSSQKPVYDKGAFLPRLMLPLSLSYDHRVIDGAEAARFVVFLAKVLGDVKALL